MLCTEVQYQLHGIYIATMKNVEDVPQFKVHQYNYQHIHETNSFMTQVSDQTKQSTSESCINIYGIPCDKIKADIQKVI